jgi:uncharacterized protein YjiS (DUF1127 family)
MSTLSVECNPVGHPCAADAIVTTGPRPDKSVGRRLVALIFEWMDRTGQRRTLSSLDDRMLVDIGVDRVDVLREVEKPFWKR